MLKITSPFREKEEIMPLIEAGADELYCGYLAPEWVKRYTSLEFERKGGRSNFTDLRELKKAVELAHKKKTPVYLALNGLYVREQYPLLLKIINQLKKIDLDGYIVADIGLLLTLRKQGFKKEIHISTGGTVFNSEAAHFYKRLGATRIILDRQTSIESMEKIAEANPDIDFEVFILNTLCVYIDGFCTFMHTYGRESSESISHNRWAKKERLDLVTSYAPEALADACRLKYNIQTYDATGTKRISARKIRPHLHKLFIDHVECGACAIYDINTTGIKSIKIVGRQLNPGRRLRDIKFMRSVLDILCRNSEIGRDDFISACQELYRKTYAYNQKCRGNNCYHPEVLEAHRG